MCRPLFQFPQQHFVIVPRIASVDPSHIDQNDEKLAAFDVAQKTMAQSNILMRAFDQSGHIANGETMRVAMRVPGPKRSPCGGGA